MQNVAYALEIYASIWSSPISKEALLILDSLRSIYVQGFSDRTIIVVVICWYYPRLGE